MAPAYATAAGGAQTEVEVDEPKKPRSRLTAPEDPERAVSGAEFDEMVRDLHGDQSVVETEEEGAVAPEAVVAEEVGSQEPPAASSGVDAQPEDLVLKDDPSKSKTPRRKRNKKHGRR